MTTTAIVLCAGKGTRMVSDKPKVLHEILGKPLLRYAVDTLKFAGATEIVSVVGFGKEQVEPYLGDTKIAYQDKMQGTADAVKCALDAFEISSGSVIITYGDCPLITSETLISLVRKREEKNSALVICTFKTDDPTGYGRIVRDSSGRIIKNIEEKDCNDAEKKIRECNAGFYCFESEALKYAISKIDNKNSQKEFYLTDAIEILVSQGKAVDSYQIDDTTELLGVNSRIQLAQASKILQMRTNNKLMESGVSLFDVATTYVSPDAKIEPDVEIWPNTYILGNSNVGTRSIVGPNSRLIDTKVGKDCIIDETIAISAIIEDGVTCGPRCYLRSGTHLCKNSKAGTCVEIKNSTLGEGSKVPHLSYVGDTQIGSGVNLGAGTITCNYDGSKKHQTSIGNDTFVGSSTMLVAPVDVGENVVIAAGSVITDNIPNDTLAFGRAKQVNKVDRFKK